MIPSIRLIGAQINDVARDPTIGIQLMGVNSADTTELNTPITSAMRYPSPKKPPAASPAMSDSSLEPRDSSRPGPRDSSRSAGRASAVKTTGWT